jgi:hypothetical protein
LPIEANLAQIASNQNLLLRFWGELPNLERGTSTGIAPDCVSAAYQWISVVG